MVQLLLTLEVLEVQVEPAQTGLVEQQLLVKDMLELVAAALMAAVVLEERQPLVLEMGELVLPQQYQAHQHITLEEEPEQLEQGVWAVAATEVQLAF